MTVLVVWSQMRLAGSIALLVLVGCADVSGLSDFEVGPAGVAGEGGTSVGGAGAGGMPAAGGTGGAGGTAGAGGAGGIGPLGPWMDIAPVDVLNTADDEDDPTFTADGLELYFNRDGSGTDILVSKRTAVTEPWPAPTVVAELASGAFESDPVIAPDGLTILFSSGRSGSLGGHDVWMSTRTTRDDPWSAPVNVTELNSVEDDIPAYLSADGLWVLLRTDRRGNTPSFELFRSQRASVSDAWDPPEPFTGPLLTTQDPWLSPNLLHIYVRQGGDVRTATRSSVSMPFAAPTIVPELDGGDVEADPWLLPNQRYIMFSRGTIPNRDIYEAWR